MKVLYVCPYAHIGGHQFRTAVFETQALASAGMHVTLLTFCGVLLGAEVSVPQLTVRQCIKLALPLYYLVFLLRKWKFTKVISTHLEYFLTVYIAVRLYRKSKFDIIQLRDAEPLPVLVHLFNVMLKDYKWVVSLTGHNLFEHPPLYQVLFNDPRKFPGMLLMDIINSRMWAPVYRLSLARNKVIYLAESEVSKTGYEKYMNGVLKGKIIYLPVGVDRFEGTISRQDAREHLGLPADKIILLSFGAIHSGKDFDTLFKAIKDVANVVLVHGGKTLPGTEYDLLSLSEKYGIENRAIIRGDYIAEEEKPYYFIASDAVILSYVKDFPGCITTFWDTCRFSIPVIANDNEQITEFVDNYKTGLIFTSQDADSLKQAIKAFLALDPEQVRVIEDNCDKFCQEFSLTKWAEKCIDIYKTMLPIDGIC